MIDGVKLSFYSETSRQSLSSLGVTFLTPLDEATGDLHYPIRARYKHLNIKLSASNRVEVNGSLHKYLKGENYSDFTFSSLLTSVSDFCEVFQIPPNKVNLHNLEFGVNVTTSCPPYEFCKRVIAYKNESFTKLKTTSRVNRQIGFEAVQQQYRVKVYDKGLQCLLNEPTLRFEMDISKTEYLKRVGISSLAHLTDIARVKQLGNILTKAYDCLIVVEDINTKALRPLENRIYLQCSNPRSWEDFTPLKRCRRKKQFDNIQAMYGTSWKTEVGHLIANKWQLLAEK